MKEEVKYPKLAANLRQWRESKGKTQHETPHEIGISRNTYSSYEDGRARPRPEKGAQIANYFGKDLSEIYIDGMGEEMVVSQPDGTFTPKIFVDFWESGEWFEKHLERQGHGPAHKMTSEERKELLEMLKSRSPTGTVSADIERYIMADDATVKKAIELA